MIKKRLWIMGIFALVCALLAVAIVLILQIEPKPDPVEDTGIDFGLTVTDEGIRVYRFTPANVNYMEIANTFETYRVRMVNGEVKIVGYETVPLLSASAAGLFNSVQTLTLETVVDENCTDLSRFGLDHPQATVTIQAYSDASVTFCIGDLSPTGEHYYMSVQGDSVVYMIEPFLAERYLKSIVEYCDRKIYKTFVPLDDFTGLTIKSPTHNYSFRKATEEEQTTEGIYFSGIVMESPFRWGGDSDSIEDVMASMVGLTADSVAAMCVDADDLAQYGLDAASRTEIALSVYADPNPTMYNNQTNTYFDSSKPTGVYENYTVTYWVGATLDRQVYVMFEGIPVVYLIPSETFSWLSWTPHRYSVKLLFGEFISDISSVQINTPESQHLFVLSGAESTDKSDLRVTCGSISVDGDSFRTFYSNLMGMYPSGEGTMPDPAGEAVLEILYTLKEGASHKLSFYAVDDRNCIANVDGQGFLTVRITEVNKVIQDTKKLLNGQDLR